MESPIEVIYKDKLVFELFKPINIFLCNEVKNRKHPVIVIYKITYENKIYIGQTIDVENRFKKYSKLHCKSQTYLHDSLKKHGIENFTFEIIHILEKGNLTDSEITSELNKLEINYIKEYNSFVDDNEEGLNLTRGSSNGKPSNETRKRIRQERLTMIF